MLALKKGDFKSVHEWKEALTDLFQAPTVMLESYSVDRMNIVAQLPFTLSLGDHKISAIQRMHLIACSLDNVVDNPVQGRRCK